LKDQHGYHREKSDQENGDDYLRPDSLTRGVWLLARIDHDMPACHYPIELSEEVTQEITHAGIESQSTGGCEALMRSANAPDQVTPAFLGGSLRCNSPS